MAKRKAKNQIANLTLDHWKLGIALISSCACGVLHIVGKILIKVTTLLQISPQSEVFTKSYGPPKWQESQFRLRDSNLGVSRQNDIWVLATWPSIENITKGKVMDFLKFRPWWILWILISPWFVRAPKVVQLCTNQLIVWFLQVRVNNYPIFHSS
jgi:hypothetical protein